VYGRSAARLRLRLRLLGRLPTDGRRHGLHAPGPPEWRGLTCASCRRLPDPGQGGGDPHLAPRRVPRGVVRRAVCRRHRATPARTTTTVASAPLPEVASGATLAW